MKKPRTGSSASPLEVASLTAGAALAAMLTLASPAGPAPLTGQERLGTIDFPTSGSPAAQQHFLRGVLLLHSFEYESAAAAFRRAQETEPGFAMAYWGEAMTYNHPVWNERDTGAGRAALGRLAPTRPERAAKAPSDRERRYLEAVELLYADGPKARQDTAYAEAMERLARDFPGDDEAKTFYALSLLGLNQGERDFRSYVRAAAVALPVFERNPDHPGAAHYVIHAFDDPIHAPLGLPAARAYSKIAPDAAHAQHMTSHIFVAMGMWDDVVAANEVAFEVFGRRSGHYSSWLQYGYLQQGRYADAFRFLELVKRHSTDGRGGRGLGSYLAQMWARQIAETEEWDGPALAIHVPTEGLGAGAATVDFAAGLAAIGRDDRAGAEAALGRMAALNRRLEGEGVPASVLGTPKVLERSLRALVLEAAEDPEAALVELEAAAKLEASLPFEFGPPVTIKPPRELKGELLLGLDRPAEALAEFQLAAARTPRRVQVLLGIARAAAALGDTERAVEAYAELKRVWRHADPEPPDFAEAGDYLREHSPGDGEAEKGAGDR